MLLATSPLDALTYTPVLPQGGAIVVFYDKGTIRLPAQVRRAFAGRVICLAQARGKVATADAGSFRASKEVRIFEEGVQYAIPDAVAAATYVCTRRGRGWPVRNSEPLMLSTGYRGQSLRTLWVYEVQGGRLFLPHALLLQPEDTPWQASRELIRAIAQQRFPGWTTEDLAPVHLVRQHTDADGLSFRLLCDKPVRWEKVGKPLRV